MGHKQAVRDITFNNSGTEFLSCGYDRYCKLWDTETGMVYSNIPKCFDTILQTDIQCQRNLALIFFLA